MAKLPSIVSALPSDVRAFLDRVREALGTGTLVTKEELIKGGLALSTSGGGLAPADAAPIVPPAPTGLVANAALSTIIIQFDAPAYIGHAYAEIWRSGINDIGTAQLIGQTPGSLYADAIGGNASVYYWVRFVSITDDTGAFNGTAGTHGTVGFDPAYLIDVLSADNPKALLYEIPEDTEINGVPVKAGIYIRDLYVADGSVSNLKIGKEVVDNSNIANLSAAKVTFGEMSGDRIKANSLDADRLITDTLAAVLAVVQTAYINEANLNSAIITNAKMKGPLYSDNWAYGQSGWYIDRDNGNAYFNNVELRGRLVAVTGMYAGDVHGGQFTAGSYTGYGWPTNGGGGAYLGPYGLLLGNANTGKYFQVTADGQIYAPGFSVVNGVLTISQANVINTLNIAGNAVTVHASASSTGATTSSASLYMPTGGTLTALAWIESATALAGFDSFVVGRVYVDGTLVSTLNAVSSSTEYRSSSAWHMSYAVGPGTHTVTILSDIAPPAARSIVLFAAMR